MQFWTGSIVGGSAALAAGAVLTGTLLVALVPAAAVTMLPRAYFARRRATHGPRGPGGMARRVARRRCFDRGGAVVDRGGRRARVDRTTPAPRRVRPLPDRCEDARHGPGARAREGRPRRSDERPRDRGADPRDGARWPDRQGDPRGPRRCDDEGPQGARRDRDRRPRDEDQRARGPGAAVVRARGADRPRRRVPRLLPIGRRRRRRRSWAGC